MKVEDAPGAGPHPRPPRAGDGGLFPPDHNSAGRL